MRVDEPLSSGHGLAAHALDRVSRRGLIYNTCWEDPALDRAALDLTSDDRLLVITSAGCNSLDYLLAGAGQVTAVDMNPAQNALLELKVVGIRYLDYSAFFDLFGRGFSRDAYALYQDLMRVYLPEYARRFWDRNIRLFEGKARRHPFFYRGGSGTIAWLATRCIRRDRKLLSGLEQIIAAPDLATQRAVYDAVIHDRLWSPPLCALLSQRATFAVLGVPRPQREQVIRVHGSLLGAAQHAVKAVLTELPFASNYFWRVYLEGAYSPDCCPEFLKVDNFHRLKAGLVDRLQIDTATLTGYLRKAPPGISKFCLLDHMDWMSWRDRRALTDEWDALLAAAGPDARVIFRSAGMDASFLQGLRVTWRGRTAELSHLLRYDHAMATALHARDRVHTYGSFHIAYLPAREVG